MDWLELWAMLRVSSIQRDIPHRVFGVVHEAGKIATAQFYAEAYPDKTNLYVAEMRKELGDLIAMIHMLCIRMGWNFDDISEEGKQELLKFITTRMEPR